MVRSISFEICPWHGAWESNPACLLCTDQKEMQAYVAARIRGETPPNPHCATCDYLGDYCGSCG